MLNADWLNEAKAGVESATETSANSVVSQTERTAVTKQCTVKDTRAVIFECKLTALLLNRANIGPFLRSDLAVRRLLVDFGDFDLRLCLAQS